MDITLHAYRVAPRAQSGSADPTCPLILLHGNGEDMHYFAHQLHALNTTREVIALDSRGHGESPRGSAPLTLAQMSDDLAAFMDDNDIAQADLLGFSDGGNVALIFALTHPERVHKLILNGANLEPRGLKTSVLLPILLEHRLTKDPARKELLGLMADEPHIPLTALAEVRMPVLVVAGTRDMIKESHTRAIADALPNATLSLIEGDHFVAATNPDAFNACVLAFLEDEQQVAGA